MGKVTLKLGGMSCAACANSIETALLAVPGVKDGSVNFGVEQATVTYDAQQVTVQELQNAVAEAGYSAQPLQEQGFDDGAEQRARQAASRALTQKVWVGGIISTILVFGSLPMMTGLSVPFILTWLHNAWFQAVLAAPVQFWVGRSFYVNGWKALKRRAATMDTLIVLGTSAAYFYSLLVTIAPHLLTTQGLIPRVISFQDIGAKSLYSRGVVDFSISQA
jgi:P-type Cu+ transporter